MIAVVVRVVPAAICVSMSKLAIYGFIDACLGPSSLPQTCRSPQSMPVD